MSAGDVVAMSSVHRILLTSTIEITNVCNLRCQHCYQQGNSHKFMSFDKYTRLLGELKAAETLRIALTGGEILLHPDFAEIYATTIAQGFVVSLTTNLTHLSDEVLELLELHPPASIFVSLYGWTDATYSEFTGIENIRDRVYANVERLWRARLPVTLQAQLTTITSKDLPSIAEYARNKGIPFRYDCLIMPRLTGDVKPIELMLPPESVLNFIEAIPPRGHGQDDGGLAVCTPSSTPSGFGFGCAAGVRSAYISSDMRIRPCTFVTDPEIDLAQTTIADAWAAMEGKLWNLVPEETQCLNCALRKYCVWCPGKSFAFNDNFTSPIAYLCDFCSLAQQRERLILGESGCKKQVE